MSTQSINLLEDWLNDKDTKVRLQRCADAVVHAFDSDLSVRVPRSASLRDAHFAVWLTRMREKLAGVMQAAFSNEFPSVSSKLTANTIQSVFAEYLWPKVEDHLVAYAIEGIAIPWVRLHVGDSISVDHAERRGERWLVSLSLSHASKEIGKIALDLDGNVIETESDSRNELLAALNG